MILFKKLLRVICITMEVLDPINIFYFIFVSLYVLYISFKIGTSFNYIRNYCQYSPENIDTYQNSIELSSETLQIICNFPNLY